MIYPTRRRTWIRRRNIVCCNTCNSYRKRHHQNNAIPNNNSNDTSNNNNNNSKNDKRGDNFGANPLGRRPTLLTAVPSCSLSRKYPAMPAATLLLGHETQRPSDELVEALKKSARGITMNSRTQHTRTPVTLARPIHTVHDRIFEIFDKHLSQLIKCFLTLVIISIIYCVVYTISDRDCYQNFFSIQLLGVIIILYWRLNGHEFLL